MPGALGLNTPQDLLAKLERELEKLRVSPNDQDTAFNFFVTAESLPDWIHPGHSGSAARKALRDAEPLLQVVSHIASGSKHFDKLSPHHQSVKDSGIFCAFFGGKFFGGGFFGNDKLLVYFKGDAAKTFGDSMPAIKLAEKVYEYWRVKIV